jgi:hypothetical protein
MHDVWVSTTWFFKKEIMPSCCTHYYSVLQLVLVGDDRLNWDEDPDRYVVVAAKDSATGKDIFKFGQFNASTGQYVPTEYEVCCMHSLFCSTTTRRVLESIHHTLSPAA